MGVRVSVPLAWFIVPLRRALAAPIKPPTARTRRRQSKLLMNVPMEAFTHIMAPFETGQITGLKWLGSRKAKLKPTRTTPNFKEFRYVVDKPSQVNQLFNLGDWDREIVGTPWKRGRVRRRAFDARSRVSRHVRSPRSRDPAALLLLLTFAPIRCPYR